MKSMTILAGALSIVLAGFTFALAQTAQTTQSAPTTTPNIQQRQRNRMERRMMMRHRERMRGGALRQLNLTDEQKQRAQAIRREDFERNRAVREELKQLLQKRQQGTLSETDQARARELRQQLQQSRQSTRTQIAGLLTEEQKTKLQEMRQEMRKDRRENRERMRQRGPNRPI